MRMAESDSSLSVSTSYMYWYMYMTYQWNDAPGTLLVCFPVPRKNVDATFSRCVGSGHLWKIDIPYVPGMAPSQSDQ